ncbi:DcaP family trimeric outer membrane transporter [Stenotrophomonas sp. PS02298]|uniref:DcaP family trimeric outer membrane transporter n=1 Tax=Stenotrophomonas sp. PS02298 TaxID=2991424 RepID=UPI00249C81AB|nr:DcaP family trimeric outer membrane transporter [Stenotrophomonas sp. PS02298]
MHTLVRVICFASSLAPACALAQSRDADQDAELKQLRETVEVLTARIHALEAKQAPTPTAEASPALTMPPALKLAISPLPARESFDEDDQATARADNDVPTGSDLEGFFPIPGTATWIRLDGYAKLDAMWDSGDAGDDDQFIASDIPIDGGRGKSRFNMHARQTRFTLEARRDTDRGQLRMLLQNDFFGSGGSYGYRLRHAWGQLGNTYVGFGWSAFMDLDSGPDLIDFAGPGASPSARVASIRQYFPLGKGNQLLLAAEHHSPELQLPGATQQPRNAAPSLVAAARHEADWGHLQLSGVMRYLAYDSARGSVEGSGGAYAGGLALSGSWNADSGDYFVFGVVGGQGIASYLGDLGGLNLDGVVDARGDLQTLQQYGGWGGYNHQWSGRWRSTLTYSQLRLERDNLLAASIFRRSDYAAVNLIWQPAPSWSWGAELLYGKLEQQDGTSADVFRVQTALKYDFIR